VTGRELAADLRRIEGRSYGFYKDLRGHDYALGEGALRFEHVQGDPFAAPSRLRLDLPTEAAGLPDFAVAGPDARRASADYLHRALRTLLLGDQRRSGSGRSGLIEIAALGPEVLARTAAIVDVDGAARFRIAVGLPARGRRILAREAADLLCTRLPQALERVWRELDPEALRAHVQAVEDQVALRSALRGGLVAFLAEGSRLPRRTGADTRPLPSALPLRVPDALRVELEAPHAGRVVGLGIERGVSVVVGGGYHGKSTLLSALALGVYDHVPGDGRERCVTDGCAVSIRAEDGRAVRGADLRPFIGELPLGRSTARFDTDDASGSTSQAAAIVEALEAGATLLLIDEDTAASNFMVRDARMRRLVPGSQEPITPYIDRVQQLFETRGVSSVLVVGGAGDYLDVADRVIQMRDYQPHDVSARASEVAGELPLGEAAPRPPTDWPESAPRVPDPASLDASRGRRAERVRGVKTRSIEFGEHEVDVSCLEQLVDPAQCRFIGDVLLALSRGLCDGRRDLVALLDAVEQRCAAGIESVAAAGFGDRSLARRFEIAAALNRLRSLRLCEKPRV